MSKLICQLCKTARATVHITDIVPPAGEKRERHLCENCAEEEGVTVKTHEKVNTILAKFVQTKSGGGVAAMAAVRCKRCGMSLRDLHSQGHLGCPQCYTDFSDHLGKLIERMQGGANMHIGKVPRRWASADDGRLELRKLRVDLDRAIEAEDYETAAGLRDQIKTMEADAN